MNFITKKPPIIQNSDRTIKRSMALHIALLIISFFSVIMSGLHLNDDLTFNLDKAFSAFGILVLGALIAVIVEVFYRLSEGDTSRFNSYQGFVDPISTGLLIALLLPAQTPLFVLAVAVIVGTYAGKLVYGGYGYYIFNPALVGALLVKLSFGTELAVADTPLLQLKEVFTSGATLDNLNLFTLLAGNYAEVAIGGTSIIVLALLLVYLIVTKVIDLRLSLVFLFSVLFITFGVGSILWGVGSSASISYVIVNLLTGLTLFGAVFLVSESVSTPTSRETKIIFAVTVAVLMMLMRTLSDYAEGVIFAVLFGNMITPFLNRTVKRSTNKSLIITSVVCLVVLVVATISIGFILQGRLDELNQVAMLGGLI